jgi:hypothetical protein
MSDTRRIVDACWHAYTGFEKNDASDLIALMSQDVVFDLPTSLPYGGALHGPRGSRRSTPISMTTTTTSSTTTRTPCWTPEAM